MLISDNETMLTVFAFISFSLIFSFLESIFLNEKSCSVRVKYSHYKNNHISNIFVEDYGFDLSQHIQYTIPDYRGGGGVVFFQKECRWSAFIHFQVEIGSTRTSYNGSKCIFISYNSEKTLLFTQPA